MKNIDFCPNCGEKIPNDAEFCPNCGFNMKEYMASLNINEEPEPSPEPEPKIDNSNISEVVEFGQIIEEKKPKKTKKKKRFLIPLLIIGIVLVIAGGTYAGGLLYFSRSHQITDLVKKATSTNPKEISEVVINSDRESIKASELKPLARLYSDSPRTLKLFKNKIEDAPTSGDVQVVSEGKIFGIYPRYRVLLKTISFKFSTNMDQPSFLIDNKAIELLGDKKSFSEKRLPGKYTLRCIGKAGDDKKDLNKELIVSPFEDSKNISFKAKLPEKKKEIVKNDNKSNPETIKKGKKDSQSSSSSSSTRVFYDEGDDSDTDNNDSSSDDSSDSDDNSIDMSDLPVNPDLRNNNSSTDGLIGHWEQSSKTTFNFNKDGTYSGTANGSTVSGKYKVVYRDKDYLNVQFNQSDGQTVVEPFALVKGHLIETNLKLNWHRVNK
ncbi:zinc-ribbon domain-containing protein [Xylocopilactobacillus apis]|uniref:Membrane protein n=1 Tax=Xylocopilactobacillus apis TaxID=2932183 RepID=A0AAU9DAA3_9LACO|nr:zinc ribbon domain-containing protein [Xylocopilactobacillus apis]BDR56580.1 membrane protein [Xylocopilactobacillus apis]